MMTKLELAADALRRLEQGSKMLMEWSKLPKSTRRKWENKALVVLHAYNATSSDGIYG